jgi:murein DD-endopeptidase MepM/ murein hydrolase activator NlpD
MRRIQIYILLIGLVFLLSCSPVPDETPEFNLSETSTPYDFYPPSTKSPLPTDTLPPQLTVTNTPKIETNTPVVDTQTPIPFFEICSPLAEQTLQEIFEIVSDPYNPPPMGKDNRHQGTDLSYYRRKDRNTIEGEAVQSLFAGRVVAVVKDRLPYGNMVIIETMAVDLSTEIVNKYGFDENESLYVLYAHFRFPPIVSLGETVNCGQPLGEVGATGYNIVNPHLHIETRIGKSGQNFLDGMAYYDTSTNEGERSSYELWRMSGEFRHFDPMSLINEYLND